jgi:P27 family predicted phage terminase small subunit
VPEPPAPLSGVAAATWDRLVAMLTEQGTLTIVDGEALFQYCRLFAETEALAAGQRNIAAGIVRLHAIEAESQGAGLVACLHELGTLHALHAKAASQIRQGRLALRVYLVELGLTPASRSRLKITQPKTPESKWRGLVS